MLIKFYVASYKEKSVRLLKSVMLPQQPLLTCWYAFLGKGIAQQALMPACHFKC